MTIVFALSLLLAPLGARAAVTFAWMSDTQNYYGAHLPAFESMARWAGEQGEEGVAFCLHTGDVTNTWKVAERWNKAVEVLSLSESAGVPVYAVAGNHDVGGGKHYENFLSHLVEGRIPKEQCFEGGICYYVEYEGEDIDLLILCTSHRAIETPGAAEWMNEVLRAHADDFAILISHSYIARNGAYIGDAHRLNPVIAQNPNLRLVLCGHARGVSSRVDEYDDDGDGVTDRKVVALLGNYQNLTARAGGYMRRVSIYPEAKLISVVTYSPYLKDYGYFSNDAETFNISY